MVRAAKYYSVYLVVVNAFWFLMDLDQHTLSALAKDCQLAYLALTLLVLASFAERRPSPTLIAMLIFASTAEGLLWMLEYLAHNGVAVPAPPDGMFIPNGTDNPFALFWLIAIPLKIITLIVYGLTLVSMWWRHRLSTAQQS